MNNAVCKVLDMNCGIDYLLASKTSDYVTGLASRVQYEKNYRTFTVRKERESGALTEYTKRHRAIETGNISPRYTMQAYIVEDKVAGLGITKTEDLMNFIEAGYAKELRTGAAKIGQAEFYVCQWDKMKGYGYKVIEYVQKGDVNR